MKKRIISAAIAFSLVAVIVAVGFYASGVPIERGRNMLFTYVLAVVFGGFAAVFTQIKYMP